ncbi:unnamed protein product [Peniophora sp. CBMAI 1063]|nr:unnamed protein product [Peniophora sp. CBMAI 1063]
MSPVVSGGSQQVETPVNQQNSIVDSGNATHYHALLDITSLDALRELYSADNLSRVRTLDISIHSAEDASTLLLILTEREMGSLLQLRLASSFCDFEEQTTPPLRAPKLQRASFAAIFLELVSPNLIELDITYDSAGPHPLHPDALCGTLSRSTQLQRLELTDCLPSNLDQIECPLSLPSLECIRLTENAESSHLLCGSFLRSLSFPHSTKQHISTVSSEDALDVLAVSAQRIWKKDAPSGLLLDVKSGYIGFHFYSDVKPHHEKDDRPFEGAKRKAELSFGVKLRHLSPLMQALASSINLSHIKTLSLCDDTNLQPDDDGSHWRSVFEACTGVHLLHLADTRGSPQPSLLLALGAQSEVVAYAEARRPTAPDDGGDRSYADEDSGFSSSHASPLSSTYASSEEGGDAANDDESDASLSDTDASSSSQSSSVDSAPPALDTAPHLYPSAADEEITPFPMLAERLRQLQHTIFIELDSPDASQGDSSGDSAPSQGDVVASDAEGADAFVRDTEASRSPESTEGPRRVDDETIPSPVDENTRSSLLGEHVLLNLEILWLASYVDSTRPVNAYTFPLEALVRALTSRAKSHTKTSASRSPRTLRVDVSVALREPGVSEPHLLEARVRFPNILWSDG